MADAFARFRPVLGGDAMARAAAETTARISGLFTALEGLELVGSLLRGGSTRRTLTYE
jgi:hypothetical protein